MTAPADKELDDLQTQIRHEADYADVELFMEGETPAGVWYRRIDDAITALRAERDALLKVVAAADAMRDEFYFIKDSKRKTGQKYDIARAALKEKP